MRVYAPARDATLEVRLPARLLVANRRWLVDAVAAGLAPGIRRVRLDASGVRAIDSAGLGALARVLRMSIDATGAPPRLVGAGAVLRESMRAVLLLRHFE